MTWNNERDDVIFNEPVVPKKDSFGKIIMALPAKWTVKAGVTGYEGKEYDAVSLDLVITDPDVRTEHADARPKLTIKDQFNLGKYPYMNKKTGEIEFVGRSKLYQIEEAFGFEPIFQDAMGNVVEARVTKYGTKVAPKQEGVKRIPNPDFVSAYFNADGTVKPDNWIDKVVGFDLGLEKDEQFGDKNVITRYRKVATA